MKKVLKMIGKILGIILLVILVIGIIVYAFVLQYPKLKDDPKKNLIATVNIEVDALCYGFVKFILR